MVDTKADHWALLRELSADYDARAAARERMTSSPDGVAFAAHDVPAAEGQPAEPREL